MVRKWESAIVFLKNCVREKTLCIDMDIIIQFNDYINVNNLFKFNGNVKKIQIPVKFLGNWGNVSTKHSLFGIIHNNVLIGYLVLCWDNCDMVDVENELLFQVEIYSRHKLIKPLDLTQVNMHSFGGVKYIPKISDEILSKKMLNKIKNNKINQIGLIDKTLNMFSGGDTKQRRVMGGFCGGNPSYTCTKCYSTKFQDKLRPTPENRKFKPRSLEKNIKYAQKAKRLDKNVHKNSVNRYVESKGIKYPPVFDITPANEALSILHNNIGGICRILKACKYVILGRISDLLSKDEMEQVLKIRKKMEYYENEINFAQRIQEIGMNENVEENEQQTQMLSNNIDIIVQNLNNIQNDEDNIINELSNEFQTISQRLRKNPKKMLRLNEDQLYHSETDINVNSDNSQNDINVNYARINESEEEYLCNYTDISDQDSTYIQVKQQDYDYQSDVLDDVEIDEKEMIEPQSDKTVQEKIKVYEKCLEELQNELSEIHTDFDELQGLKDWNDLLSEMKVRELSYREHDMSGSHALIFLDQSQKVIQLMNKYDKNCASILKYLLIFRRFLVHSSCHKNYVRYTDDFLNMFKFAVILDDHLYHLFLEKCYQTEEPNVGWKQHQFYHVYMWMDFYRFSPAWVDDQKSENLMKLLKRMFRYMGFNLNKKKLRALVHQINMYHYIKFDMTNTV